MRPLIGPTGCELREPRAVRIHRVDAIHPLEGDQGICTRKYGARGSGARDEDDHCPRQQEDQKAAKGGHGSTHLSYRRAAARMLLVPGSIIKRKLDVVEAL